MQNQTGFDFLEYQKKWIEMMQGASNMGMPKEKNVADYWKDMLENGMNWQKNIINPNSNFLSQWTEFQTNPYGAMGLERLFPMLNSGTLSQPFSWLNTTWTTIQNNIKNGIYSPEGMNMFFPNQQLDGFIKQLLNISNADPLPYANLVNQYFNTFLDAIKDNKFDLSAFLNDSNLASTNPLGVAMVKQFSDTIASNMGGNAEALQKIFPSKERDELIDALKAAQYNYLLFLFKSNTIQTVTIEKGKKAFLDTIQYFSNQYDQTQELPSYEAFSDKFLNLVDESLVEYYETKEYSQTQSEMVLAATNAKKEAEKIKLYFVKDLPLVKYAEFDDALLEISVLKKKNRSLESRLSALEEEVAKGKTKSTSGESLIASTKKTK